MWEGRNIIPFLRSNQTPFKNDFEMIEIIQQDYFMYSENHVVTEEKFCPLLPLLQLSNRMRRLSQ